MQQKIGSLFREQAKGKRVTPKLLANRARITEGFTKLVLADVAVRLSDRVFASFCKTLKLPAEKLKPLQAAHNRRHKMLYAKYEKNKQRRLKNQSRKKH